MALLRWPRDCGGRWQVDLFGKDRTHAGSKRYQYKQRALEAGQSFVLGYGEGAQADVVRVKDKKVVLRYWMNQGFQYLTF